MLAYYLWVPAVYLAVYVPVIVPRLAGWNRIPTAVLALALGPFLAICVAVGAVARHRHIAVHGALVAAVLQLGEFIGVLLRAPGMGKSWVDSDPTLFWLVLFPLKVAILIGLSEVGHVLAATLRRSASGTTDT